MIILCRYLGEADQGLLQLVYKVRTGSTIKEAVDDIVLRNVVELRKSAFGDDVEDAKNLPWTRAQAWKVVSELAKKGEVCLTLNHIVLRVITDAMFSCRMLCYCRSSLSRARSRV